MTENEKSGNVIVNTTVVKKTKIRGGHKAHIKKLFSAVDKCVTDFDLRKEPELLALQESLRRKTGVIAKLDEEILEVLENDEEIVEEIVASEETQLYIQTKITEVDCFLKKMNATKVEIGVDVKTKMPVAEPTKLQAMVKLPKLQIEKFSGDPKEYSSFRDAFMIAIGDNKGLSKIEKFTYLRSYLSGEAENSINGLAATSENYDEAMAILEQRYGNKQVIVNSHMDALIKLPQVVNVKQTKKIRQLYDQIETNLRSLKSLGVQPES